MEKESEDEKLRKRFREEGEEYRGEFGTFLPPLKSNIRTARKGISE